MLRVVVHWSLLTAALCIGAVGFIRARPYDSRGLETMLHVPSDCAAPCWQGIRPGDTTGPAALMLVDQIPVVRDLGSQFDTRPSQIFWHWLEDHASLFSQDDRWSYIWLEENTVSNIFLPGFRQFADLYLLLGQPEAIVIFSDSTFALGPVVYLSIYPNQMYLSSFITCRSDKTDLWRAPTNIHIGQRPEYGGAFQREFQPADLPGWLPDRLCLRG